MGVFVLGGVCWLFLCKSRGSTWGVGWGYLVSSWGVSGRLEGGDDGKGEFTYHGGCGRSSNALVYLPCRLDRRRPVQTEGRVVLLWTVLRWLLLLLLSSLLLLLGSSPTIDPGGHRQLEESSGVRVDGGCK